MPIDIDKLTEAELIDLNNRVVARLKFARSRSHARLQHWRESFVPARRAAIIDRHHRQIQQEVGDGHY